MSPNKISHDTLKENNLFKGVSTSEIKSIFNPKNIIEIKEGDVVYQKGEKTEAIFLIISGEAKIKLRGATNFPVIAQKIKNEFFGEKELIEKTDRKSSSVANTNLCIYKLEKEILVGLIKKNSTIKSNLFHYRTVADKKEDVSIQEISFDEAEQLPPVENLISNEANIPDADSRTNEENFEHPLEELNKESEDEDKKLDEEISGEIWKQEETPFEDTADVSWSLPEAPLEEKNSPQDFENPEEEKDIEDYFKDFNQLPEETEKLDFNHPEPTEKLNSEVFFRLLQAVETIHEAKNVEESIRIMNNSVTDITSATFSRVLIENAENENALRAIANESEFEILIDGTLSGKSFSENEIINRNNLSQEEIDAEKIDGLASSILYFPITGTGGKPVAIVELFNSSKFSETDEEILSLLSISISKALTKKPEPIIANDEITEIGSQSYGSDAVKLDRFLTENLSVQLSLIHQFANSLFGQTNDHLLNGIIDTSNAANDLIQTVSSFNENDIRVALEENSLNEILKNFLPLLAEYADGKNIKILKNLDDDVIIKIDKIKFYHVCFQIIKNSCESMPEGGTIYISSKKNADKIILEFKDEGIGVPASMLNEMFDKYSNRGMEDRAGLGLALAKNIIEKHEGNIAAESEVGEGTIIRITLPV